MAKGPDRSNSGEDAGTRFFEEERRRRRMFDEILGARRVLEQADATSRMLKEAGGAHEIARQVAQARETFGQFGQTQLAMAQSLKDLVDFPALRIAQDMAARLAEVDAPYREAMQTLSASMAATMANHRSSFAAIAAQTKAAEEAFQQTQTLVRDATRPLGSLIAEATRQFAEFAEAARGPDWEQLLGSMEAFRRDYVLHAGAGEFVLTGTDAALDVARALENVSSAHATDHSTVAALFGLLLGLLRHVAEATDKELRSVGLVTAFMIIATIKSLGAQYTAEDRRVAAETHQIVERVEARLTDIAEAEVKEHAYVDALPKAVVTGAGRVRVAPGQAAPIITKLPRETIVGLSGRQGRWMQVVYRDELKHELQKGWVYVGSLGALEGGDLQAKSK